MAGWRSPAKSTSADTRRGSRSATAKWQPSTLNGPSFAASGTTPSDRGHPPPWSSSSRSGPKRAIRGALALGGDEIEQAKAIRLRKHVFGGLHWPEGDPAHQFDACAERLRSDLANIVPA